MVTSNCNCFSSSRKFSIARDELLNSNCEIVKLPFAAATPSRAYGRLKYYLVRGLRLNYFLEIARGFSFFFRTGGCSITHFDQVLRSFGILSFLTLLFLSRACNRKVIVTVHEMDPLQEKWVRLNRFYNKADRVIVFSEDMKAVLCRSGVDEEKIEIIPYGVPIDPLRGFPRDRFIYFGGHKLLKGKGFDTLLQSLKILEARGKKVQVVIYVGEGCIGLEEGKKMAAGLGLDDAVQWSDFLFGPRLAEAYQRSLGCLIPFTGGAGRYPATCAMANATPVVATRKAGLPEYLGELGIYIREDSPEELADAMILLQENPGLVASRGEQLKKRAEERFSYEVIAPKILRIYREVSASA
jgi:glycosyltransferase involved in cell wall biosynthesis